MWCTVLYTYIDMLNDDVLLKIFNHYRLSDEENWNRQLRWCKIAHVCRRWRHLIYTSFSLLNIKIHFTNGTHAIDLMAHLPPLPLVINYQHKGGAKEEENTLLALKHRGRIHNVMLQAPSQSLHKLLVPMDEPFTILEHLSILSTCNEDTSPILPRTFLAPNLRHFALHGVGLPTGLPLLASTFALVTLSLTQIRPSVYFRPEHLVTHLQHLPQLEELSIGFLTPMPRPNGEAELLRGPVTRVTVPSLKRLIFRGVAAYLEGLIARISSPLLERLNITLFNQLVHTLPHLSDFTSSTEGFRRPVGNVTFGKDAVSMFIGHRKEPDDRSLGLQISCKEFDWQIDSAAQVCRALMLVFSFVEELTLGLNEREVPSWSQNDAVDRVVWHELLEPFSGVKRLHVGGTLAQKLSSALNADNSGLIPDLLPELQEIVSGPIDSRTYNAFTAFLGVRRFAGRPARLVASKVDKFRRSEAGSTAASKS
jgi:F-box-like